MRKVIPKDAVLIPAKAKRVFEGVIYDVYQWEQQNFDDSVAIWEMIRRPDTVSAICIVEGKILVLDEEQPHRGSKASFPGGRVDESDESTLEAAKREVKEETGYEFANWRLVNVVQPQVKLEWFIHIYVASEVKNKVDTNHDAGERITCEQKSLEEVKDLAEQGHGFIGENRHILKSIDSLEDLVNLPEYNGQTVSR